jgi:hypothetical protein
MALQLPADDVSRKSMWQLPVQKNVPDSSLTSSGDRIRNGFVYINVALNIL